MKFYFRYQVTQEVRDAHLIKTGDALPPRPELVFDMLDLTVEQRAAAVKVSEENSKGLVYEHELLSLRDWSSSIHDQRPRDYWTGALVEMEMIPTTAEEVFKAVEQMSAANEGVRFDAAKKAHDAQARAEQEKKEKKEQEKKEKEIEDAVSAFKEKHEISRASAEELDEIKSLAFAQGILGDSYYRYSIASAVKDRKRQLADDKREAAEKEWINSNGSNRLKRGYAEGHDMTRIYVRELFASIEGLKGWELDYKDTSNWKDRVSPTTEELDALDAAREIEIDAGEIEIVWLTHEPTLSNTDDDEYDYGYEPFEGCAAIVIRRWLGKYDLIKRM